MGRVTVEVLVRVEVGLITTLLITINSNNIVDLSPVEEIYDLHPTASRLVRFVVTSCNMKEEEVATSNSSIENHFQNLLERFDLLLTPNLLVRFEGICIMKLVIITVEHFHQVNHQGRFDIGRVLNHRNYRS